MAPAPPLDRAPAPSPTSPSSFSSGSSLPSGLASSAVGASALYGYRPWSTARFRRCSFMTARVSSEYVLLRRLEPSASLGERNARSGAAGAGSAVGGTGKGSAEEDMFPFASRSFAPSPSTAVTSTDGGVCDGTGLRRAIAVPPPVPGVVVLTPNPAPAPPVGKEELPGAPCVRTSCDRPANRVGFLPPLNTSGDVVGGKIGQSTTVGKPADASGVFASLEERSWPEGTARRYSRAECLLDSMRDWRRASSMEEVYTICTWCGGSVSVYGDFKGEWDDVLSGTSAKEIACATELVSVAGGTSMSARPKVSTATAPFIAAVGER